VGFSPDHIRGHIEARRWTAYGRRVVALQTGPLTQEQLRWVAVLDGGPRCVLGGLSALHVHGLVGFPTDRVQTVVPRGVRATRTSMYVRRQSRRLTGDSIHPVKTPPCLRVEPALVDALTRIEPRRGCALIAAVVQQRLVPASALPRLLAAERALPHHALYLATARDVEGGSHSLLEVDFVVLARRAGLRPPVRQSIRLDRSGRRRYLDADFDTFAVEVDGAVHLKPLTWWDDMARQNAIVLTGKPILRFSSVAVRLAPDEVIAQLREAQQRWRHASDGR
jgi:hypothetical protein